MAAGLLATWGLTHTDVPAWWLMPVVVVAATVVSLRRAARGTGPRDD